MDPDQSSEGVRVNQPKSIKRHASKLTDSNGVYRSNLRSQLCKSAGRVSKTQEKKTEEQGC